MPAGPHAIPATQRQTRQTNTSSRLQERLESNTLTQNIFHPQNQRQFLSTYAKDATPRQSSRSTRGQNRLKVHSQRGGRTKGPKPPPPLPCSRTKLRRGSKYSEIVLLEHLNPTTTHPPTRSRNARHTVLDFKKETSGERHYARGAQSEFQIKIKRKNIRITTQEGSASAGTSELGTILWESTLSTYSIHYSIITQP